MSAIIVMSNGDCHRLRDYASKIVVQVNEGRGKGQLIALERDSGYEGQMIHIDPDLVMSIKDDR